MLCVYLRVFIFRNPLLLCAFQFIKTCRLNRFIARSLMRYFQHINDPLFSKPDEHSPICLLCTRRHRQNKYSLSYLFNPSFPPKFYFSPRNIFLFHVNRASKINTKSQVSLQLFFSPQNSFIFLHVIFVLFFSCKQSFEKHELNIEAPLQPTECFGPFFRLIPSSGQVKELQTIIRDK